MGRKKKDPDSNNDLPLTTGEQKKLSFAPTLVLEASNVDPFLAKIIIVSYISLVDLKKLSYKKLNIEENRFNNVFLYCFENKEKGIVGYVGRNKDTDLIKFLAVDQSRFKWAKSEGFFEGEDKISSRSRVFTEIGVLIELEGLNSFINFIAGDRDYKFVGEYIKSIAK